VDGNITIVAYASHGPILRYFHETVMNSYEFDFYLDGKPWPEYE